MLATGVDGVMIGRGAQGKPWLVSLLKGGRVPKDKYAVIEQHVRTLREHYDEAWLTLYMRKHFLWYTADLQNASKYRLALATSPSIDESLKILKEILK